MVTVMIAILGLSLGGSTVPTTRAVALCLALCAATISLGCFEKLPECPVILSEEDLSLGGRLVVVGGGCSYSDDSFDVLILRHGEKIDDLSARDWRARRVWKSLRPPLGYTLEDRKLRILFVGSSQNPTVFDSDGEPREVLVPSRTWNRDGWAITSKAVFPASDAPLPTEFASPEYREVCDLRHAKSQWFDACSEYWGRVPGRKQ